MSLAPWSSTLSLSSTEFTTLAVVLGIVGGLLFVILLVCAICFLLLRCRSKRRGDQFASPTRSDVMTSPAMCFDAQFPRPQRLVWQRLQMATTIPRPTQVSPDSLASGQPASDETCVVSTH